MPGRNLSSGTNRRGGFLGVVLLLFTVLALATAPAASALPYGTDGEPELSTTSPAPGAALTVGGDGFQAGSEVRVVIYSEPVVLGVAEASAAGEASIMVTIPEGFVAGSTHTLQMQGIDPSGDVRILEEEIVLVGEENGDSGDSLASTGFGGTQLAITAGILLVAGAALVAAARSRRSTRT